MPIVKAFVDRFGGVIEVESRPRGDAAAQQGTLVRLFLLGVTCGPIRGNREKY